jgi:hypothetical protein
MILKINDHEPVELRFTFSSFIAYEDKFGEPINLDNISFGRLISFYYFVVLCSKKGWQTSSWLSMEEFQEWLDNNPDKMLEISTFIGDNFNLNDKMSKNEIKKN